MGGGPLGSETRLGMEEWAGRGRAAGGEPREPEEARELAWIVCVVRACVIMCSAFAPIAWQVCEEVGLYSKRGWIAEASSCLRGASGCSCFW